MIEPYNTDAEFLSRMKLVCGQRCCYRAEGNVNLALHLLDANKVILLRKTNVEFNVKQHCRGSYLEIYTKFNEIFFLLFSIAIIKWNVQQ